MKVQILLEGDSIQEVEDKIESYERNYHPGAYGVRFGKIHADEDKFVVTGSRYDNCD